jgi:hypothetical protein
LRRSRAQCRWISKEGCSEFYYDEKHELLAVSSWSRKVGEQMNVEIKCVKGLGG